MVSSPQSSVEKQPSDVTDFLGQSQKSVIMMFYCMCCSTVLYIKQAVKTQQ